MPATPDDLFAFLNQLGIAHATVQHEPMFTVAQSAALKASLPGAHTKNLFMSDGAAHVLIAAEAHHVLKLNHLHKVIGTRRLSFGPPGLMMDLLGVSPGSVTAFALINDRPPRVRFLVDAMLAEASLLNFHPLTNTATTAVSGDDFRRFVAATEHSFDVVDFDQL